MFTVLQNENCILCLVDYFDHVIVAAYNYFVANDLQNR